MSDSTPTVASGMLGEVDRTVRDPARVPCRTQVSALAKGDRRIRRTIDRGSPATSPNTWVRPHEPVRTVPARRQNTPPDTTWPSPRFQVDLPSKSACGICPVVRAPESNGTPRHSGGSTRTYLVLASKDSTTKDSKDSLPFGAIEEGSPGRSRGRRRSKAASSEGGDSPPPARGEGKSDGEGSEGKPRRRRRSRSRKSSGDGKGQESSEARSESRPDEGGEARSEEGGGRRRRRKRRRRSKGAGEGGGHQESQEEGAKEQGDGKGPRIETGMFVVDKGGIGVLRRADAQYRQSKGDIYVPKNLIQREKLRDGAMVTGRISRGQKHKFQLVEVHEVDGKQAKDWKNSVAFKNLTSIDPDFHYAVGDVTGDVSMRVIDLLCPIGRGQRGLIVAPPRSGKTTILRQFAAGIEEGYPDVHLMVLLIDERPEEATEWTRSVNNGQVFVSTADETAKAHIQLAEAVWMRACRLVEMGEDVVILLDSITRLARAYNNQAGSGRTMSGGLDSRAMERPRKIFGSARNTVEAGSLTILGTTLVETGSRMDQLVFEEFKGTGNMELVLNRKLADRRVFPAIDVERSGTRKEEKLVGMRRLKLIHTLRRVLSRLNFVEAMELLITRLEDVEKTDDFLARFEVDPEA